MAELPGLRDHVRAEPTSSEAVQLPLTPNGTFGAGGFRGGSGGPPGGFGGGGFGAPPAGFGG